MLIPLRRLLAELLDLAASGLDRISEALAPRAAGAAVVASGLTGPEVADLLIAATDVHLVERLSDDTYAVAVTCEVSRLPAWAREPSAEAERFPRLVTVEPQP